MRVTILDSATTTIEELTEPLRRAPKCWLVTGVAGFIGSNLLEALLNLGQRVVGLDNYSTGRRENLVQVRETAGPERWKAFRQIEGDTRDFETCRRAVEGVDYVLHQAALGSVPRSLENPGASHANNVSGFLNMLVAARDGGVRRFVYASSSSVYGDHPALSKKEAHVGRCLSPYAATKRANELYAEVFGRCYGLETVGLRYFNVFGPRQDPEGHYAAVIPKWIATIIKNAPIFINGDGETSRDFCYVANVVQANLLAATVTNPEAVNEVYNVAVHARTSLNQLLALMCANLQGHYLHVRDCRPVYRDFRSGDVRHSDADISKAQRFLGYQPSHTVEQGLSEAVDWYKQHLS
jgi:UDP-N-acetylglucosamine 4-epimerase